MALMKCPECKKKVSDQCSTCPNCGYSIQNYIAQQSQDCKTEQEKEQEQVKKSSDNRKRKRVLIVALISIVVIAITVTSAFVLKPITSQNDKNNGAVSPTKAEKYSEAVALMEAGKYSEAIEAFTKLDGYKDSADLLEDCEAKLFEEKYLKAVASMEAGFYYQAMSEFGELNGYKDSAAKAEECKELSLLSRYNEATALLDSGDVIGAYEAFRSLGTYKDSESKVTSLSDEYQAAKRQKQIVLKLASANVNASVQFGAYEQDNVTSNGAEAIEWRVAAKDGSKILLVSEFLLDIMQYDKYNDNHTWESCSLRKWLNNDFLNTAFSSDEKALIATTNISPEINRYYTSVNPGSATTDKVFILSMSEVQEYCDPPLLIYGYSCEPTMYAREKYSGLFDGTIYGEWWIRTPGRNDGLVTCADRDGDIAAYGWSTDNWIGVRPAVWIDLS